MSALAPVTFLPRREPLPAVAVAALGANVRALAQAVLRLNDDALTRLTGVASAEVTVVLGSADSLPWFDGALFLGSAGALLWPTWATPCVHPLLLERALRRDPQVPSGPLALIVPSLSAQQAPRIVPLGKALPLSRAKLLALARLGEAA